MAHKFYSYDENEWCYSLESAKILSAKIVRKFFADNFFSFNAVTKIEIKKIYISLSSYF